MLANLPTEMDARIASEVLDEVAADATITDAVREASARCALFLLQMRSPRCSRCAEHLGSPSRWAELLEKAGATDNSSAAEIRTVVRVVTRFMRGWCSQECELGTAVLHG